MSLYQSVSRIEDAESPNSVGRCVELEYVLNKRFAQLPFLSKTFYHLRSTMCLPGTKKPLEFIVSLLLVAFCYNITAYFHGIPGLLPKLLFEVLQVVLSDLLVIWSEIDSMHVTIGVVRCVP